jgi:hypothetical protein
METTDYEGEARRQARAKLGFITHATIYLLVMTMLVVTNLMTSPGHYWFLWPMLGWGSGLLAHGLVTFLWGSGNRLERHLVNRELRELRRRGQ